jgi:hypothetical protein
VRRHAQVLVIASNRVEPTEATLVWYRQSGKVSENGIKEMKISFGMERMRCGQFAAASQGGDRWRLFHLLGKLAVASTP